MQAERWLKMAQADAAARGLDALLPLFDGLAGAMRVLRTEAADGAPAGGGETSTEETTGAGNGGGDAAAPGANGSGTAHGGNGRSAATASGADLPAGRAEQDGMLAISARVRRGELKAERLVEECLERIAARQPELNAFITVTADEALAAARAADRDIAAGRHLGPLHGMPVSLKDLIDQAGVLTTAGSRVLAANRASADAPVTARLRAAGAVLMGKTNLHEFAFGTTSDDSAYGPARNPHDPSRSPGGSSGGSAISVATGMALGSVGTDTGGSIRIPAAACGIVGLKPAWGEVPAGGVVPLSRQLDHVGPLGRSVADVWAMFDVMRGAGAAAGAGADTAMPVAAVGGLRVGVLAGYFFDLLDEQVDGLVRDAIERLRVAGAKVTDVPLPHVGDTAPVYLAIGLADAAAYHAPTLDDRPDDYTTNVRLRLELGRYVMGEDYVRAQALRARLAREVDAALATVDVLALPALGIPAPPVGATVVPVMGGETPVRAAMLRCTQLFNLTGHPAISLPCGATREGLPAGLQLVGRKSGTTALLAHALGVERVLGPA